MARLPVYLRALHHARRARHRDRLQRGARHGRRGQLRQAAQGPLLPRLLRHPRRRLRRRVPALPDRPRARPDPGLAGRHRRHRKPGPRARQLRRLRSRGFRIAALLDADPAGVGEHVGDLPIRAFDRIEAVVERRHRDRRDRHPGAAAQEVCDRLVAAGVTSILNFAPCVLSVPDGVDVRKVDLVDRAADPRLPRAAQGPRRRLDRRRRGREPRPQGGSAVSVLVVGVSHRTAPRLGARAARARRRRRRQARARRRPASTSPRRPRCLDLQPHRDLRRGRPLPRQRRGRLADALRARRRARPRTSSRTSTSTTTTARSPTSSRWPPASTRWSSARARSSARSARRCASARRAAPSARPSTRCSSRRCASASGCTPRPTSTGPRLAGHRGARPRRAGTSAAWRASGALVVGAGAMAGLAVATVARRGAADVVVASRTRPSAERLAAQYAGRRGLGDVEAEIAAADVLVSCTGATGVVLPLATGRGGPHARRTGPLAVIDLALPHDVDPAVADLPGVELIDLGPAGRRAARRRDRHRRRGGPRIVAEEVTAFLAARRSSAVTPTVVALRTMATGVVDAEMARLPAAAARPRPGRARRGRARRAPGGRRQAAAPADRAGQGAGQRDRRRVLRRRAGRAVRSSTPTRSRRRPGPEGRRMTPGPRRPPPSGWAPAPAARPHPVRPRRRRPDRRARPRGRARRRHHRGRRLDRAAGVVRRRRRLRQGAARRAARAATSTWPCTPSRTCRPRRTTGSRWPRCRPARTPGRRGRPRRAHPGRAAGRGARRHRLAAAGRPAARARSRFRRGGDPWQRGHRIGKVASGEVDAVVLARAGVARLGRLDEVTEVLDPLQMLPAPGQGALAVECRATDTDLVEEVRAALDDPRTRAAVTAERTVLADLEAGCSATGRGAGRGGRGRRRRRAVAPGRGAVAGRRPGGAPVGDRLTAGRERGRAPAREGDVGRRSGLAHRGEGVMTARRRRARRRRQGDSGGPRPSTRRARRRL